MRPQDMNPLQWNEHLGLARQSCARVFRNGGSPADALAAYGLKPEHPGSKTDWPRAVERIALALHSVMRRAA